MRPQTSASSLVVVMTCIAEATLTRTRAPMKMFLASARRRHQDEFPGRGHRPDGDLDQRRFAPRDGVPERCPQFAGIAGPAASGPEALGVFDEVRIGEI